MMTEPDKQNNLRFFLLLIPAAYVSYLFHELGHWSGGELLGNEMAYSLNYAWPKSGSYVHSGDAVLAGMGGPAFSIIQSLIALLIIEKYHTLYAYPFAFFPMFSRYFSLLLGGFEKQDEAQIALMLGVWKYLAALVVLVILTAIVARCSSRLGIGLQKNMYVITGSTVCQLLVIGTYKLFPV
ncbi:MAG: hypothetical protein EHM64_08325 [Ignavibacteriae bacterium]|nr:MAG: hypothetical protein EHM64_08325 [Ignavibacteriota bacterium]